MKKLLIASTSLVLSWLPATASALLIQYDIDFQATLWSPELPALARPEYAEGIKKSFSGTAVAYFDGQTIIDNDFDPFSLPMSFNLDVDGTTLAGDGVIEFFTSDTYISMNFDSGPITVSTNDFIFNDTVRDGSGNYLYNELLLPMDMPYISDFSIGRFNAGSGAISILENVLLDPALDRTLVTVEQVDIRLFNGQEIFSVPAPATLWLLSGGLLGMIASRKKTQRI